MRRLFLFVNIITVISLASCKPKPLECREEKYRPQLHFSVPENWANDPNGLVYFEGEYHFHYQYTPDMPYSGQKSWAHSISTNLVTWSHLPVALSPDSLGDIFSGSAVVDYGNTTGFQQDPNIPPIVAIFTHFTPEAQQQSIAYSLNKARDYVKYEGNPVIPNTNTEFSDFRDPKVIRYGDTWVMVLAVGDRVRFYSSPNLKNWTYLSEFGADPPQGSHAGVWECPDLLRIEYKGYTYWVLLVSASGGGPNGGSFTQYFIGLFNGREFESNQVEARWMDWGPDNYASVSFSNEPLGRQIIIGWMSNSAYSSDIPTGNFRGQMTLPRVLTLDDVGGSLRLKSSLVDEFDHLRLSSAEYQLEMRRIAPNGYWNVSEELGYKSGLVEVDLAFNIAGIKGYSAIAICFLNRLRQELCVGYDHERPVDHEIFVNRELTGDLRAISDDFWGRATSGRVLKDSIVNFKIVMDLTAVELFVDGGLTVMTSMFFPDEPLDTIEIRHHAGSDDSEVMLINGRVQGLRSIYDC